MNGLQLEKLVGGETVLLQRSDLPLVPIDGINLTDRFQLVSDLCSPSFIVIKETRGEPLGRILMFARHLIAAPPESVDCGGYREWRILLKAPYIVREPPRGWELHVGRK
jgi:hypothetical protein